jgi:hypothetical protein
VLTTEGTAEAARRLRVLREESGAAATAGLIKPYRVALYVLVEPGRDPADRFALAQVRAVRSGCEVVYRLCDSTGMTDPFTRPSLARAYTAVRRGEIQGIVAASRTDISTSNCHYEQELRRLRTLDGFLFLALDETRA